MDRRAARQRETNNDRMVKAFLRSTDRQKQFGQRKLMSKIKQHRSLRQVMTNLTAFPVMMMVVIVLLVLVPLVLMTVLCNRDCCSSHIC